MLKEILSDPDSLLGTFLAMPCYDNTYFGREIEGYAGYATPPYIKILLELRETLDFTELMKLPQTYQHKL